MFLKIRNLLILFTSCTLLSCSEYQKILSKGSIIEKNKAAEKYYSDGEYRKALNLFEQIMPAYKGKPQAQRVVFFFANSYFKTKDYYLAAYQF
jgi:outer membrane protein assembly factor BamD